MSNYIPQMTIGGTTYKMKDTEAREGVSDVKYPVKHFQTTNQVINLTDYPVTSGDYIYVAPISASSQAVKGLRIIGKYTADEVATYDVLADPVYFGEVFYIKARRAYDSIQVMIYPWANPSPDTFAFDFNVIPANYTATLNALIMEENPKQYMGMRRYFAGSYSNSIYLPGTFAEGQDIFVRFVRATNAPSGTGVQYLRVSGRYYDENDTLQTDILISNATLGKLTSVTLQRTYKEIAIIGNPIISDSHYFGFVFDFQYGANTTEGDLYSLLQEKKLHDVPFTLTQASLAASTNNMRMSIPHAKRNYTISFDAEIASDNFGQIDLYLGTNPDGATVEKENFSKLSVRPNKIVVTYSPTSTTSETVEYNHDVTIGSRISFMVHVKEAGNADIIISSPGAATASGVGIDVISNVPWKECVGFRAFYPSNNLTPCLTVSAISGVYHYCVLKSDAKEYDRKLWSFGDSYFGLWTTYAIQCGYDDTAFDAFGGRQGWEAWKSLELEATKRTPRKIFWALGMNGGDTKGTDGNPDVVNAGWYASYNNVVEYCEKNDIELILCTIPTTPEPTRYHEAKNAIIKASGFRYVDVAAAVGSDASTNYGWYPGLLGSDQTHPTALGNQVIAAAIMASIPELARLDEGT